MTFPFEGGYWIVNGNKYQLRITKKVYEWFACVVYAKPMRYNIWYNIDVDLHPTQHLDDASFHGDLLRIVNSPFTQPKNSLPVYGHQPWISKKISEYSEHFWCKDFVSFWKDTFLLKPKKISRAKWEIWVVSIMGPSLRGGVPGFRETWWSTTRQVRILSTFHRRRVGAMRWGSDAEMLRIGPFGAFLKMEIFPRKFWDSCWKMVGWMYVNVKLKVFNVSKKMCLSFFRISTRRG